VQPSKQEAVMRINDAISIIFGNSKYIPDLFLAILFNPTDFDDCKHESIVSEIINNVNKNYYHCIS
jgi:hypothetical protein